MRAYGAILGCVLALLATGCAEEMTLPEELIGTYTTSDPRYADRYLEMTADEVVFGLGAAGSSRHLIKSVLREEDQEGKTLYTLAYAGDGGTDPLRFFYDEERKGEIVLRNQAAVTWKMQGAVE